MARLSAKASPMDDQGNLRRVTFSTEGADFDLAVDPTGRLLAYASTRHRDTADIYLQSTTGTAVTQLTTDPANDVMPAISPDGRSLAFASDRSGSWDLYLMDLNGGQAIKLTDDGAQNIHPSFSPDGPAACLLLLRIEVGRLGAGADRPGPPGPPPHHRARPVPPLVAGVRHDRLPARPRARQPVV